MGAKPSSFLRKWPQHLGWLGFLCLPFVLCVTGSLWLHLFRALCSVMAVELSWGLCVSRALTKEGLWAGQPWGEAAAHWRWTGRGCWAGEWEWEWSLPSAGKQAQESLTGRVWSCSSLPSLELQDSVPMLEVPCRGEFSTPPTSNSLCWAGLLPTAAQWRFCSALGAAEMEGWGLNVCNTFLGFGGATHPVLSCLTAVWVGSVGVNIQGWVLAQQVLSSLHSGVLAKPWSSLTETAQQKAELWEWPSCLMVTHLLLCQVGVQDRFSQIITVPFNSGEVCDSLQHCWRPHGASHLNCHLLLFPSFYHKRPPATFKSSRAN